MSTTEEKESYRSIFKATSLFGGLKVYQIVLGIVKSKVVAVLLGTAGVGIQGLYQSALGMFQSISSLGIGQSAVRDVAEANGTGDSQRIGRTISVLRRLVFLTGGLGMLAMMLFAPVISRNSFGDAKYTFPLILLATTLLIDQICAGQTVLLQGLRKIKDMAAASAVGITVSLLISIPIYYFFRIDGIVPIFVLNSCASVIITWYFTRKIKYPSSRPTLKEVLREGGPMVKMGIALSLSGMAGSTVHFLLRSSILRMCGEDVLGLYQAGLMIVANYIGLVFSAIGSDFYPRLAMVNNDPEKGRDVVSRQGELTLHILAPMLCLCILLMPVVLQILYSDRFIGASSFIWWSCPGMLFNLGSWLLSFVFVVKSDTKLYLITQLSGALVFLGLSWVGCKYWSLTGLGIALTLNHLFSFLLSYFILRKRYGFSFTAYFTRGFILQLVLVGMALAAILCLGGFWKYFACSVVTAISIGMSFKIMNSKMDLAQLIRQVIKRPSREYSDTED